MALPSGLTLKIELLFGYKSDTPKIRITDETDYAAEGRTATNIRGVLQLVNSEGVIAYQNTSFDAPDLDLSVSNVVIITPSNCGCSGKIDWCDTFTLTYSIQDISDQAEFEKDFEKYICFTPFEATLKYLLDCYTATLTSSDCTTYKQNGITPTFTEYNHKLLSKNDEPLGFDKLKTEYNFDCGKKTTPQAGCDKIGNSGSISSASPFVIDTSTFDNPTVFDEAGEYEIEYDIDVSATITISDSSSDVVNVRTVPAGIGTYTITTATDVETISIAVTTSANSAKLSITPPCGLSNENDFDTYSKCCNTISLVYPELYSGLHEHSITADLVYDLGDNWFILYEVVHCEEFEVECLTDLCTLICALYDKYKTYLNYACKNPTKAEALKEPLMWAFGQLELHGRLINCGREPQAAVVANEIMETLNLSKSDCGCGCSGDNCEPQKILPVQNTSALEQLQVRIMEGDGIDVTADTQTLPNTLVYKVAAQTSEFDGFEYLSFPFTENTKDMPMAFATAFTDTIEVHDIDANFVTGLSYSINHGSFIPVTLPLASPISFTNSAHIVWRVDTLTATSGSIVLKYKTI